MWLINTKTLSLEKFDDPPAYAILSHTWGRGEVTFEDISDLDKARSKPGFEKISETCEIARERNLDHAWVDTCCINKTSSAELSEAINSMFAWYQNAAVCFAYLHDVGTQFDEAFERDFSGCRWFKRGWTLQELIAPRTLEFYSREWLPLGTKKDLAGRIKDITGIPEDVIKFGDFSGCCIAQRMSWAADRETKRPEDIAYCLLGVFGVNMPMLYGMGSKAFMLLQEEIIKTTNDLSIFAWQTVSEPHPLARGIFATSPDEFRYCRHIVSFGPENAYKGHFNLTNIGLSVRIPLITYKGEFSPSSLSTKLMRLHCRDSRDEAMETAVILGRSGDRYFRIRPEKRVHFARVATGFLKAVNNSRPTDIFIVKHLGQSEADRIIDSTGCLSISLALPRGLVFTKVGDFPPDRWDHDLAEPALALNFSMDEDFFGFCLLRFSSVDARSELLLPPAAAVGRGAALADGYLAVTCRLIKDADQSDGSSTERSAGHRWLPVRRSLRCSVHHRRPADRAGWEWDAIHSQMTSAEAARCFSRSGWGREGGDSARVDAAGFDDAVQVSIVSPSAWVDRDFARVWDAKLSATFVSAKAMACDDTPGFPQNTASILPS